MKIGITGALGRMGRAVFESAQTCPDIEVSLATVPTASAAVGQDYGSALGLAPLGLSLHAQLSTHFDVLIDFTTPEASLSHVAFCQKHGKAIVLGTTGFSLEQQALLRAAGRDCPVFWSPNMSIGMQVLNQLLAQAAGLLKKVQHKDIDILEAHHRHKKDAPSGTALKMGQIIADALDFDFKQAMFNAGTGEPRRENSIGFTVRRSAEIVGEHTAIFNLPFEQIQLSHVAHSRQVFAEGALQAARWLGAQPSGYYSMQDFVALSS